MLKNTGYFRGIDCPFRESCPRPHCPFRHRERGGGGARSGAEYDPCCPELPVLPPRIDEGISNVFSGSSKHILELERVNKAIEEVKSQVERQQRKYEELLETQNAPLKRRLPSAGRSSFEYDPGCSGSSASCYNPTPLAQSVKPCKYTLDNVGHDRSSSRSLEYVPTKVTKVSRSRINKYVIDNSKPYTDMEYDPMLNYSARLLGKGKPAKGTKRSRAHGQDEGRAPGPKKLRNQTSEVIVEAKFSDSEDDSQSQCSPKIVKPPSHDTKSSSSTSPESPACGTKKSSRTVKEMAVQYDIDDIGNALKRKETLKIHKPEDPKNEKTKCVKEQPSATRSGQTTCISKGQKKASSKGGDKNSKLEEQKPKTKSPSDQTENKKDHLELSISKTSIFRQHKKDNEKKPYKEKSSKSDSRAKDRDIKNGKHKAKNRRSVSLDKSKMAVQETCNLKANMRTLSHVDLFGDETSDEEESRKTNRQSILTSDKGEKSSHKSKAATRRTSVSSVDSPEVEDFCLEQDLDSDSDVDPMEECLRVFNESHDIKTEDKGRMGKQADPPSKVAVRPYSRPTPQEICYQRIQKAQEQAAQLLAQQKTAILSGITQGSNPRRRVANVPGDSNAHVAGTAETSNGALSTIKRRTLSGMASKTHSTSTERRQAHAPTLQSAALKRPVLPTEFGAKVPTTVRQRYLNLFIDECLKSCPSQPEAFNQALEEEKTVYSRSSSRNIYLNVAVNTLKKLRSRGSEKKTAAPRVNKKVVSHESVLGGKLAAKTSFSVQRTIHQDEELTESTITKKLKNYILTPEELKEHGYPMPHPEKPGRAMVYNGEEGKNSDSSCKICCRCGADYLVTPSGNCVRQEECVHHWGRLRRQRAPGGWETYYSCCSGAVGSTGCQVAKQHVQDGRKDSLDGFVKTFEKFNAEGNPGVFALDCEMCYTKRGLELTRVTVINTQLKVVYDTFVLPDNKIVDYNTRFSGVTEEDLQNTSISLRDVQAVLLSMFSCHSILIGHSLESDLFALKLIHPTVVDTAVVFPHRLGLPYKRALRSLMADHLKRIIQDNVEGHDSSEDACSCMELMIWRIKEDAKVKR
ncbi:RNA exonuclease 1 homolog isoform X2 [Eleutherodactylus coqui]|uniref:RNA exonuclease 1 homolog isoform X2 n=1 Tax=Eleutherodactylus coqui TaxID=57060 RepID=UPI003461F00F